MDQLNMAILGTGNIATSMAETIAAMPHVNAYAVASRTPEKARQFASAHGFTKAYGSYEELVQDDKVQLVYIASPHSHHAQHAMLCLTHGRPVLCEKAFTANAKQAKEVLDYAKEHKIFITEAIWTRYMPLAKTLNQMVNSGTIGQPLMLRAELGYPISHIQRMSSPELAGGALLDVGVYPITFASVAFGGDVEKVSSAMQKYHTGVDAMENITLFYKGSRMASLQASMCNPLENGGAVFGEEGMLIVGSINNYQSIRRLSPEGEELEVIERPPQITGYEYEVDACIVALQDGRIECPEMPHAETLRIMELLDSLRQEWGIRFPFE